VAVFCGRLYLAATGFQTRTKTCFEFAACESAAMAAL
jgi:hypothetical protein